MVGCVCQETNPSDFGDTVSLGAHLPVLALRSRAEGHQGSVRSTGSSCHRLPHNGGENQSPSWPQLLHVSQSVCGDTTLSPVAHPWVCQGQGGSWPEQGTGGNPSQSQAWDGKQRLTDLK